MPGRRRLGLGEEEEGEEEEEQDGEERKGGGRKLECNRQLQCG